MVISYLTLAEIGDKVLLNEGLRLKFSVFGILGLLSSHSEFQVVKHQQSGAMVSDASQEM